MWSITIPTVTRGRQTRCTLITLTVPAHTSCFLFVCLRSSPTKCLRKTCASFWFVDLILLFLFKKIFKFSRNSPGTSIVLVCARHASQDMRRAAQDTRSCRTGHGLVPHDGQAWEQRLKSVAPWTHLSKAIVLQVGKISGDRQLTTLYLSCTHASSRMSIKIHFLSIAVQTKKIHVS